MRYVFVILMLTAIALGVVHLRRKQRRLSYEIRDMEWTHKKLKREIWSLQVELGELLSPEAIAKRLQRMGLADESDLPVRLAPAEEEE